MLRWNVLSGVSLCNVLSCVPFEFTLLDDRAPSPAAHYSQVFTALTRSTATGELVIYHRWIRPQQNRSLNSCRLVSRQNIAQFLTPSQRSPDHNFPVNRDLLWVCITFQHINNYFLSSDKFDILKPLWQNKTRFIAPNVSQKSIP